MNYLETLIQYELYIMWMFNSIWCWDPDIHQLISCVLGFDVLLSCMLLQVFHFILQMLHWFYHWETSAISAHIPRIDYQECYMSWGQLNCAGRDHSYWHSIESSKVWSGQSCSNAFCFDCDITINLISCTFLHILFAGVCTLILQVFRMNWLI